MRVSLIIVRRHDREKFEVIEAGDPQEVNKKFNALTLTDGGGLAEAYLHELKLTDGRKRKIWPR